MQYATLPPMPYDSWSGVNWRLAEAYDGYSFPVEPEPESPESIDLRNQASAAIQRGLRRRKGRINPFAPAATNLTQGE